MRRLHLLHFLSNATWVQQRFIGSVFYIQIQGTLHRRNYFYIGEKYVTTANQSVIASGQIYVEHLVPAQVTQALPLVFIHGHDMTGTNFLNTPDGRLGWADFFLGEGYEVKVFSVLF